MVVLLTAASPLFLSPAPAQAETAVSGLPSSAESGLIAQKRTQARRLAPVESTSTPLTRSATRPSVRFSSDDGYGSISGTVTDSSGTPVEGAVVYAYSQSEEDWIDGVTTNSDGSYLIADLSPGRYTLEFDSPEGSDLAGEWWRNKTNSSDATYFRLGDAQDLEDFNAVLGVGGTVAGRVVNAQGEPLSGATVWVADAHGKRGVTDADGAYVIPGAAPGKKTLIFDGPDDSGLGSEWWNDKPFSGKADFFAVSSGSISSGKNAALAEGGSIEGEVWDNFWDEAASDVTVYVLAYDKKWYYVDEVVTDEDGYFSVSDLYPGVTYAVIPDDYYVNTDAWATAVGLALVDSKAKVRASVNASITGSPEVGATLKVNRGSGSWSGVKAAYSWLVDGEESGVTGTSYRITPDDLGNTLSVQVTGSYAGDTMSSTSRETPGIVRTARPRIDGIAQVGETLVVDPGEWTDGTQFTYEWLADKTILGETGDELIVPAGAAGKRITVKATGSLAEHATVTKPSGATAKVMLAGTPKVTGTQSVGSTLGVDRGKWTSKVSFRYRWLRDGELVANATKSTYKLTAADLDHEITVELTGKRSGYSTVILTSDSVGQVVNAGKPKINGVAGVDLRLTADAGTWATGTTIEYAWYAGSTKVSSDEEYVVGMSAADQAIRLRVTARLANHADVTVTSAATPKVMRWQEPTIPATATVGQTLTAVPGKGWTSKTAFSYQWFNDGVAIARATKSTYRVATSDSGPITVTVTGKRSGYATVSATSEASVIA